MTPTAHHRRFIAAGRWCSRLAWPLADLDLPERLDLPAGSPILFAGNHRSFFDVVATLAIFARFDVSSRILIRADLVDSGVSGQLLRRLGSIGVSSDRRDEAEETAVTALQAGQTVSMMPEGRLVPRHEWQESGVGSARPGLSRIARRAGALVVPVAFVGTERVWPRGGAPRPRRPRPKVTVRLGPPIEMDDDDDQVNADAVMARLGTMVRELEAG